MPNHLDSDRIQALWNTARDGDYGPLYEVLSDQLILINGPGAGPWHRATGKDDAATLLLEFSEALDGTFHQDGGCVYADDRVAISLVQEVATAPGGDPFNNLAVYVTRLSPDNTIDRIWTVDLDSEHCEDFWKRNEGRPSRDFS